jgi:hypothetical protein
MRKGSASSSTRTARKVLALALLALAWAPSPAHAQGAPPPADAGTADIDRARSLAKQANRALKAQSYAEALDAATQAEALYHAPFHLAIIGESLAALGRVAEAMTTFERLVSEPLPPTAPEAFRTAQEDGRRRLKELAARVPSLLVVVKGASPSAAKATVDGKPLSLASGVATRLDPGAHKVHVEAPGYAPFDQAVALPAKGGVVVVDATLETAAGPQAPGDGASSEPADGVKAPSPAPWAAAFAVGGAGLVVGGVTGGLFLSRLNALKARCHGNLCAASDQGEAQSIGALGNVSTAAFVVGGVGVAVGVIVLAVQRAGKGSQHAPEKPAAGVALGFQPGGATLGGWF